jgi:hypothetical protein
MLHLADSWWWPIKLQDADDATILGPGLFTGTRSRGATDLVGGENGLINVGRSPVYYPPIHYTPTGLSDKRGNVYSAPYAPGEARNYLPNSSFAAWDSTKPTGWSVSNSGYFALTQCGSGLGDTRSHLAPYAVKVVGNLVGAAYGPYYTFSGPALAPFLGRYVTACIWTYLAAGEAVKLTDGPTLILSTAGAAAGALEGAASWRMTGCEAEGVWTRQYVGLYVDADCTSLTMRMMGYPTTGETVTYYMAEPFIAPGFYGQNGWIPNEGEFESGIAVHNGAASAGYVDLYEDSDHGVNYIRLAPSGAIGASRTMNLLSTGFLQTVIKTISSNDDASTDDYQFDDDAANHDEQVITLTDILPAYAELISWQVRCFETVTGSAALVVKLGTSSGGTEVGTGSPDTANDIIGSAAGAAPLLAATNAARALYFAGNPDANWNTPLNAGRWAVMITYLDYAAVYTQKNP